MSGVFIFVRKDNTEMVDTSTGAMPTTEPKVEEPLTDVTPKAETKTETALTPEAYQKQQDELERTRKALKDANKEAADRRKRLEELEKLEADRKAAEMTEAEKAQARIKELENEKAQLEARQKQIEYKDLQNKVAKAVAKELDIPFDKIEALADRLRGTTEEELIADAKSVFAILPKQEAKPDATKLTPKIEPTNPANGMKGETRDQAKARLLGRQVNVWDPQLAAAHGGGVVYEEGK